MSGLDDLLKGLAVFHDGMKQYATTQAVNDANTQLQALNAAGLKDNEKLQASTQLAQGLAMRLGAAGADAAHIQTLTSQLAPSQGAQYESGVNADLQQKSQGFQEKMQGQQFAHQDAMQERQLDALMGKNSKKAYDEISKSFEKRPDVKPLLDNFPKIDEALQRVKDTKGQMGATAAIELAKLGLIRGAAGRVNETEIKGANESPSMRAQLWKKMGLEATGEVPKNVQEFWSKLLEKSKSHIGDSLDKAIAAHGAGAAALNDMVDGDKWAAGTRTKYGNILGQRSAQPAQGAQQPNLMNYFTPGK